jgi:hypothetical protein
MTSQSAQEKGDALEHAVRAIETVILRSFPGYSESAFRIQGKRSVSVAGVRHEIDLHVMATIASGYEAIWIFECKNWQEKVGKNEIIVFSEKVKATNAQRGFFVAKSYTSDAEAQASQDQRVELLLASELDPTAVMVPASFHGIHIGETDAHLVIRRPSAGPHVDSRPFDITGALFELEGTPADMKAYVNAWVEKARRERCGGFPSASVAAGVHCLTFSDERQFSGNQAMVNGEPVATMKLTGRVQVQVNRAFVVSAFEVASRGRVITVEVDGPAVQIRAEFVELIGAN